MRLPTANQVETHSAGLHRRPKPDAFALSPRERALREEGRRVSVSVWDRAKITADEARARRGSASDVEVYELDVDDVRAAAQRIGHPDLDVVEDRAGAPDAPPKVQDAHAGITGLDAAPVGHPTPKKLLKDARVALAVACRGPVV